MLQNRFLFSWESPTGVKFTREFRDGRRARIASRGNSGFSLSLSQRCEIRIRRDSAPVPEDGPRAALIGGRRTCARITQPHCPSAKSTAREVRDTSTSRKHDHVRYGLRCHASIRRAERMHVARAPPPAAPIRGRPARGLRGQGARADCRSEPTSDARRSWTGKKHV